MGDQLVERPPVLVPDQEIEDLAQDDRPVHGRPHDLLAAHHDRRRVEGHGPAREEQPDVDVGASPAEHGHPLGQEVGEADELQDDVGAPAPGELVHHLHPLVGRRELLDVDGVVGAELPGHLQPGVDPVEHDHLVGAHVLGHGGGGEPQTAGPLDDDVVTLATAGRQERLRGCPHGAVDRGQHVVAQAVRHLEHRHARRDVVVVGERSDEIGERAGRRRHRLVEAEVLLAP